MTTDFLVMRIRDITTLMSGYQPPDPIPAPSVTHMSDLQSLQPFRAMPIVTHTILCFGT